MPNKFSAINLAKSQKGNALERTTNWLLSIGRILVIVTELIALGAFLWRFGLDQQLIDLHSAINKKQAIVAAFKANEDEYRNLQDRLSIAQAFAVSSKQNITDMQNVLSSAPDGISFSKFDSSNKSLSMELNVTSVSSLSSFVSGLKSNPNVISVSIDKIETKTNKAVIVVNLSAQLKNIQNQYAAQIE